jgi:diketogulonate reductase-like aldo/keto reductase
MNANLSPVLTLNNGQQIPQLGLGVYKLGTDIAEGLIAKAIETGYRRIDTAAFYGNEAEIGAGVRSAGIPRDDIFVTTKIWNDDQGFDRALEAIDKSLARLDIDYIDMLLVHWPKPQQNLFVETWAAFQKAMHSGKIRGIGVSNFQPAHLETLLAAGGTVPALNQIELHPGFQQATVREFNHAHGIATEAWSPLARGRYNDDARVLAIAEKHSKTPTQIIVRWHLDLGNLVIPKTATASRLQENISVFDFNLDADDMAVMASLEEGLRTGPNPDEF